jgi:hypothetical protein
MHRYEKFEEIPNMGMDSPEMAHCAHLPSQPTLLYRHDQQKCPSVSQPPVKSVLCQNQHPSAKNVSRHDHLAEWA